MRVKNVFFTVLTLATFSCTSMNKYVAVEGSLNKMKKDSLALEKKIEESNKRIDELIARTISLSRDTLRLYSDNAALKQSNNEIAEKNRQEIARLNSLINASSRKSASNLNPDADRVYKISSALTKSVKGIGEDMRLILRNEKSNLYNISYSDWEVAVYVSDELLFEPVKAGDKDMHDRTSLSTSGISIVNKISKIIVEKANYDIIVREYVSVRSPKINYVPKSIFDEISEVETEQLGLLIDSLMEKGIIDFHKENKEIKLDITNEDLNVDSLGLITPIANIKSKISKAEEARIAEEEKSKENVKGKYHEMMKNFKTQSSLRSNDRTSTVMRLLMKDCYDKLGANTISKDATYVKMGSKIKGDTGIIFIFKPKLTDLYKQIEK